MLSRYVSWLASEWSSNVRSPAGYHPDLETQRWIRPIITILYGYLPRELME
jgi:hypothetical protein